MPAPALRHARQGIWLVSPCETGCSQPCRGCNVGNSILTTKAPPCFQLDTEIAFPSCLCCWGWLHFSNPCARRVGEALWDPLEGVAVSIKVILNYLAWEFSHLGSKTDPPPNPCRLPACYHCCRATSRKTLLASRGSVAGETGLAAAASFPFSSFSAPCWGLSWRQGPIEHFPQQRATYLSTHIQPQHLTKQLACCRQPVRLRKSPFLTEQSQHIIEEMMLIGWAKARQEGNAGASSPERKPCLERGPQHCCHTTEAADMSAPVCWDGAAPVCAHMGQRQSKGRCHRQCWHSSRQLSRPVGSQ